MVKMKVIQIVPELNVGGVEQHVLWLSNELVRKGHQVLVVFNGGGGMPSRFSETVKFHPMPVHRKEPLTALYCAISLARIVRNEKWDIIHAHSRVPFWVGLWTSMMSRRPFVATAHSCYSINKALYPLSKADGVITISETVKKHIISFLPPSVRVIYNGLPDIDLSWKPVNNGRNRFLFVGRLSRKKGLQYFLDAISGFRDHDWHLDIVGEGPFRAELEKKVSSYDLEQKVVFHGFQAKTDKWMKECSCFIFPSLEEGMGLTLMQAIKMGVPILASDIPAVRELSLDGQHLIAPGSSEDWMRAIAEFFDKGISTQKFDVAKISSLSSMARAVEEYYNEIILRKADRFE